MFDVLQQLILWVIQFWIELSKNILAKSEGMIKNFCRIINDNQ